MRKKIQTVVVAVLVVALLGMALALIQRDLQHTGFIVFAEDFTFRDPVSGVVVTGIDWGGIARGSSNEYTLKIKNEVDFAIDVWWNVTGLPTGLTLTLLISGTDPWAENTNYTLNAGSQRDVLFTLDVASDVLFESFDFTQNFYGVKDGGA